uniref:NADH-ubiquinone oxidoreductase chain 4L n=1 Tax=Eviota japonica TaxID=1828451 RepID=A0A5K7TN39_9GOBI|nr:NADH dehydrogenase subunit 4L [Eviota japonica]
MDTMMTIMSITFMIGLAGLAFYRTHLLSLLLCLEAMMLSLIISSSLWALESSNMNSSVTPLMILTLSACEAGAGLSILVATTRTQSDDAVKTLDLLKC